MRNEPRAGVSDFFVRRFNSFTALVLLALPAQAKADWQTLERGDRGSEVKVVQKALTKVRLPTRADGVFGASTLRNVRRYERRHRIAVDGRVSKGQARGLLKRASMDTTMVDAP